MPYSSIRWLIKTFIRFFQIKHLTGFLFLGATFKQVVQGSFWSKEKVMKTFRRFFNIGDHCLFIYLLFRDMEIMVNCDGQMHIVYL